jgi:uncharacterized protein YsxB (DUF464 family)
MSTDDNLRRSQLRRQLLDIVCAALEAVLFVVVRCILHLLSEKRKELQGV